MAWGHAMGHAAMRSRLGSSTVSGCKTLPDSLMARSYKADFTAGTQALQVAVIEPTII